MTDWLQDHLAEHVAAAQTMSGLTDALRQVGETICRAFAAGGVLYTCGNGGSAADAQHLTGELIGRYRRERRGLPAVTLSTDPTVMTCVANDYRYEDVFARQVQALTRPGDVLAAFTTSGMSRSIIRALSAAQDNQATTILFAGGDGGRARGLADHLLLAPSGHTPRIQEMHTLMLHVISEMVDAWAAGEEASGGAG